MGGSGGGSSGQVEYPNYIENIHALLVFNRPHWDYSDAAFQDDSDGKPRDFHRHPPKSWEDFIDNWTNVSSVTGASDAATQGIMFAVDSMIANNPYNPGTDDNPVITYDPDTNFELSRLEEAMGAIDAEIENIDSFIEDEAQVFEEKSKLRLHRSFARVNGQLRDINAVIGTAQMNSFALIETEHNFDITGARVVANKRRVELLSQRVQLQNQVSASLVTARTDQLEKDLGLSIDEQHWELETLLRGLTSVGAIAGVAAATTTGSGRQSGTQRVLGGALAGAAAGSAIPGVGTGIGAAVGGVLGLFG